MTFQLRTTAWVGLPCAVARAAGTGPLAAARAAGDSSDMAGSLSLRGQRGDGAGAEFLQTKHARNGNDMAMTWQRHGNDMAMGVTWQSHGKDMAMAWQWHGNDVARTWQCHGNDVAMTWQ